MPKKQNSPDKVDCSPTKQFFVSMLTRDIELGDAILDLLDNCVDGAVRSQKEEGGDLRDFSRYEAKITFDRKSFVIEDNCGGIPLNVAKEFAFRMGKPEEAREENLPTVGVYGIGMKRALFKMGRAAKVMWRHGSEGAHEVAFDKGWFKNDDEWTLPITALKSAKGVVLGTRVTVGDLLPSISAQFAPDNHFRSDFVDKLRWQYSYIINNGFNVFCNGQKIEPRPLQLLDAPDNWEGGSGIVRPYIFKGEYEKVGVFVAVGLTNPLQSEAEAEKQQSKKSSEAGITVICNDRVVLYNDRTAVTCWGEPRQKGAPAYHTQFISIGGFVHFSCADANKLPMTTTKRSVDENSPAYQFAKERLREGLKTFTWYTNQWKKSIEKEGKFSRRSVRRAASELMEKHSEFGEIKPRSSLPTPPRPPKSGMQPIKYRKHESDIKAVSSFLFGNSEEDRHRVGEAAFDHCLRMANEGEDA